MQLQPKSNEGLIAEFKERLTYIGNDFWNSDGELNVEKVTEYFRTILAQKDKEVAAYQTGISKIADELRKAGLTKTADKIAQDLELLKLNPTVENVLNYTPKE